MKNRIAPAIPLITHDPYFSLWSASDQLFDSATMHWAGRVQRLNGNLQVDNHLYRFLGDEGSADTLEQVDCHITATTTTYQFEGGGITLTVRFTSPLLMDDLHVMSRPCTYLSYEVASKDGKPHDVTLWLDMNQEHCHTDFEVEMVGGTHESEASHMAYHGKAKQSPLNHSGDLISIDWGYLYMAAPQAYNGKAQCMAKKSEKIAKQCPDYTVIHEPVYDDSLVVSINIGSVTEQPSCGYVVLAYDDTASINYFGDIKKGYWADGGATILDAIDQSIQDYDAIMAQCEKLDERIQHDAVAVAGEAYAHICALAYRQSIAAHKLIKDNDGNPIFLSKECNSNGCIGTVDVSYPSIPLYLIHNPELVKAMIRPVLKFAKMPVWTYDFAPHDVGRYPYATGQVYALKKQYDDPIKSFDVHIPYYQFPNGSDIYDFKYQMPLEECGNMLIMVASAMLCDGDTQLAEENMELLKTWAEYLVRHGIDPGEQLCTDDFAGHLAHNANLSVKAIMGIAAYGIICDKLGDTDGARAYMKTAQDYTKVWEQKVAGSDHTPLTFDNKDSWGQKYNLIWDKLFGTKLFSESLYTQEIAHYLRVQNKYGLPLDNRANYTKSDWILWCAALSDNPEETKALIDPVYRFLLETQDRVPFSDWYDTKTAIHHHFRNRTVQGGLFMPILKKRMTR